MVALKSILLAVKTALASRGKRSVLRTESFLIFFIVVGLSGVPWLQAQTFTNVFNFGINSPGFGPMAGLILSGNTLYGTTAFGDDWDNGTVFSVKTDGTGFANLHSFSALSENDESMGTNSDGAIPFAGLVLSGSTLYGTAQLGGVSSNGTVFAVNTDGSGFKVLHNFAGPDGNGPLAGLVLSGATLYGTTVIGGNSGYGTVFAVNTNGAGFTNLYSFNGSYSVGGEPRAGLILSDGTLYGTTSGNEVASCTVFKINTDGTGFEALHIFNGTTDGLYPVAGLILSGNTLYGTTEDGGSFDVGTIFSVNTDGTDFTNLHNFDRSGGGIEPADGLILLNNTLYGTAEHNDTNGIGPGTIFAINTDGTGFTNVYTFVGYPTNGSFPNAGLILSGDTFYGTTYEGGNVDSGTIFSLTVGSAGAPQGSLQVTIEPSGAVSNGAQWQVDGGTLQNNGATVNNLSVGDHTLSFSSISNWTTPANQTVSISSNSTTTATGTYTAIGNGPAGALTVTLQPAGAVLAGAQWSLDYGAAQDSGLTITNLSVGSHNLTFTTISGWGTPAGQNVTITDGATLTVTAYYTSLGNGLTGALSVTLEPAGAVAAGAQWQVDGGAVQDSGDTATNLSAGSHTLSFTSVSGWITPADQTVTVTNEVTTTATGVYAALHESSDGLTLLTNGYGTIRHGSWPDVLRIGKSYTLTAVPSAGNLFSNWEGGTNMPYSVLGSLASYTFTMRSNLVLQANFVTNAFLAAQGAYRGLFGPPYAARQKANSGSFSFNLSSSGTVSGALSLGGQTVPISGKFGLDGAVYITSIRHHGETTLTTALQLDVTNQSVSGTVSDGIFYASLKGYRDMPGSANAVGGFQGQYTLIIPGTNNPAIGPLGVSYGMVKVDAHRNVTLVGSLADGTAISQSSVVSKDGYWPVYINLYGGNGSLWGWVYFTNQTLSASPLLSWISTTNAARTALYRSGFSDQDATLTGGLYVPGQNLPGGLIATLTGGNLPSTITVSDLLDNSNRLALKFNKTTGVVSGSFANPADAKQMIKFTGVYLQGQTNAQGYFLGTNQSGVFTLGLP